MTSSLDGYLGQDQDFTEVLYRRTAPVIPVPQTGLFGGLRLRGRTSSSADPTTTEYPSDGDYGIHKNTTSGSVFLAFNDGGTIRKAQLT